MIRKTSAMVEAGILAAIAIVFAIISMYVPVIGSFINFFLPPPYSAMAPAYRYLRYAQRTALERYDADSS